MDQGPISEIKVLPDMYSKILGLGVYFSGETYPFSKGVYDLKKMDKSYYQYHVKWLSELHFWVDGVGGVLGEDVNALVFGRGKIDRSGGKGSIPSFFWQFISVVYLL